MKPGEGFHGELETDERMPAFVRFRVLVPASDFIPGKPQLFPSDLGLRKSYEVLRHFDVVEGFAHVDLRRFFDGLIAAHSARPS